LQTVAYLFSRDGPRAFGLMFLKIAEGALQVNVLSGRKSWADLEKSGRAGLFVTRVPPFQNPVQITTLRTIHRYLTCGDELSTGMHPVVKKSRGAAVRLSMLGEDCPASAPRLCMHLWALGKVLQ
jgi:hypothetical protein